MILIKFLQKKKKKKLMSSDFCLNQIYRSQIFIELHFLTGPANNIIKIFEKL